MKGGRFSEKQIIGILREHEAGQRRPIYAGGTDLGGDFLHLWTAPLYQDGPPMQDRAALHTAPQLPERARP
jgi:hypothetical protein